MAETGSNLIDFKEVVAEAGKRVKLPSIGSLASADAAASVVIQALSTNEGKIAVGSKTVVAAPGTHAAPTTRGALLNAGDSVALDINDTGLVYIDATVSGDGINALVLTV